MSAYLRNEMAAAAWHDVTCPEGRECRSRWEHAHSEPMVTSGILGRFLDLYHEKMLARIESGMDEAK